MAARPGLTPARRRLWRWLAVALGLLLPLLLAELGLRLWPHAAPPGKVVASVGAIQTDFALRHGVECYPTNPRGYFREGLLEQLPPGALSVQEPDFQDEVGPAEARARPYGVSWETDRWGTRGPDPALAKPAGTFRVLAVGDSFTFGEGVFVEDTYVARLAQRLDAEPINGGRPDTGLADYPARLREQLACQPDLIVLGLVLNDGLMSAEIHQRQRWLNDLVVVRNRRSEAVLSQSGWHGVSAIVDRWRAWDLARRVTRGTLAWYHAIYDPRQNPAGVAASQAALTELAAIAREAGVPILVALWPLLEWRGGGYPFGPIHGTLATWCEQAGLPVLDLLPALRAEPCEQLWVYPTDHHPNERAHALAAEALAAEVRRRGWR